MYHTRLLNATIESDNLWPIATGLVFTPGINVFTFKGPFLKLGQNIGLFVGAVFWGVGSDIWGRRLSFNLTLFNTGVFFPIWWNLAKLNYVMLSRGGVEHWSGCQW